MSTPSFVERFAGLLDRVELVTFDVFDTALVRGIQRPDDLFLQLTLAGISRGLLSRKLCARVDFAQARRHAEREARRWARDREGRCEVRLGEIYERLAARLDLDGDVRNRLMRLETEIELAQNAGNPYIHMLHDLALRAGKRTGFVSDMYLDEALVRRMLQRGGYSGFAFVHVSSTAFETKAHGTLYARILSEQQIPPTRWLHVGDNYDSDVNRARLTGIHALHYEKCAVRLLNDPGVRRRHVARLAKSGACPETRLFHSIRTALIANRAYRDPDMASGTDADFWTEWGYRHVGPLLAGFGAWLVSELRRMRVPRAYFLARDGYLIRSAVERMLPSSAEGSDASTDYLYASRRSFNFAAISQLDDESLKFLAGGTSRLTPRQYLARIDIDIDSHMAELEQSGLFAPDQPVLSAHERRCLRKLLCLLEPRILDQARSEFATLKRYFEQCGVLNQDELVIVDLGWHGSLQDAIAKLIKRMGSPARTTGFYLGTFAPAKRYVDQGMRVRGYLCENGSPAPMDRSIKLSVEIIEWIFSAPHGGVRRFVDTSEGVVPLLAEFDFEPIRWERASSVQRGALDFLDDYLRKWNGFGLPDVAPREAIGPLIRALSRPSLAEADALGDLKHTESFGHVAMERYIARPRGSLRDLLSYPRLLLGYRDAFWRAGYARRMFGLGRRS